MGNNKILPFERNRYYTGKLLTANDFNAEQLYNSGKRRFLNNLMFGNGVVCGLGVYNLDDLSVIIESGVAIDNLGREVVLENSVVKKLSTIEGFDKLSSDEVELFVKYDEEETHPVFSVNSQSGEEYQCNKIRENLKFVILDAGIESVNTSFETEFLNRARLYQDSNYSIYVSIPSNVSIGCDVKLEVEVKKTSVEDVTLDASFNLVLPAFYNEEKNHDVVVALENLNLHSGETKTFEYWVTVGSETPLKTMISVDNNTVNIVSGEEITNSIEKFSLSTEIVEQDEYDIVSREIGKISLENRNYMEGSELIRIAKINLIRTDSLFIIGGIEDKTAKKYIRTNANEKMMKDFLAYFKKTEAYGNSSGNNPQHMQLDFTNLFREQNNKNYSTGILEVPLDVKQKIGDVVYSDEIVHGLGKGNVYVDVGLEYITEDKTINKVTEHVVYGDSSLFESQDMPFSDITTAVKVMPDKGSFIVAVKLLKETDLVLLKFRWNAIKFTGNDKLDSLELLADMKIVAETPTVVLGTKESHFFKVKFHNMAPCSLNYQLTEENSGEITSDGIYTAPAKEGVFEILITCVEHPFVSTYAYAVVKRKGNE